MRVLWEKHRVEDVASPEGFVADPALVWRFYSQRRAGMAGREPNDGHRALAALEAAPNDLEVLQLRAWYLEGTDRPGAALPMYDRRSSSCRGGPTCGPSAATRGPRWAITKGRAPISRGP